MLGPDVGWEFWARISNKNEGPSLDLNSVDQMARFPPLQYGPSLLLPRPSTLRLLEGHYVYLKGGRWRPFGGGGILGQAWRTLDP
jgi:hypothetical protein